MSEDGRPDDRVALARWLTGPDGTEAIAAARAARTRHPDDPLAAAGALRADRPGLAPDQAAAALEQATLQQQAASRYGMSDDLLLTRDGLEQATRPAVAARRARLLAASGATRVLDLTGGLGLDCRAFAAAGLAVTAVERDPVTAVLLAHNCPQAEVVTVDATEPGTVDRLLATLSPDDVVFADPARRDPAGAREARTGRARPERDPARWSPPWPFLAGLPHPRIAAKVAPGFTPPDDWQAEWISVDRTVVECALYSWPVATAMRRAVIVDDASGVETLVGADGSDLPMSAVRAWLHEPDPSVLRAGALGALRAYDDDLARLDGQSTWLTSDSPSVTAALRSFLVITELTGSARQQRRQLAEHGIRRLTVKSRDVDVVPRTVLRDLGVAEGPEHVLVLTRIGGRTVSWLCEPAAARSG